MKIILFMSNFAHDHFETKGGGAAIGGWLHGGMGKASTLATDLALALGAQSAPNHLPDVLLRKESWGGLVFQAKNPAVYQVDQEGFDVLRRLMGGESKDSILASNGKGAVNTVKSFFDMLHQFSII